MSALEKDKQVAIKPQPGALVKPKGEPAKPKRKKIAMEEDEFTETMAKIIRRDFFPDLPKMEAQLAYIEATETSDTVKLREISERFATGQLNTPAPNATPSFDTPNPRKRSSLLEESEAKKPKPEDSKSLDEFLTKYHSEDDASFNVMMEREEEKRREKYAWMYERENLAKSLLTTPAITAGEGERPSIEAAPNKLAITDGSEHGKIKMWDYTAKNTLMYMPEGLTAQNPKTDERKVVHNNTRLPREFKKKMASVGVVNAQPEGVENPHPPPMREKFGIDGKQLGVGESPKVNGYGFVATPQINPGVDASPLMTWGTIDGTPLHIDADITATPGPTFKIPKVPQRDAIAHKLAEKATKSLKEKKKAALAQATSTILSSSPSLKGSMSERLQMLSPAARKLVNRTGTPGGLNINNSRSSYTPGSSPMSSPRVRPHAKPRTPSSNSSGNTPSLTDNLLKLK